MVARDSAVEAEIRAILDQYELGRLLGFERNRRGFVNTSYALETEIEGQRRKYFLRRYKRGTGLAEIQFEHSIILHLLSKGFQRVAPVIAARSGETYVRRPQAEGTGEAYYAVFEFLSGEDRYTWNDPHCTSAEITEAASVLAEFHHAVSDLAPKGSKAEPGILDLLGVIPGNLEASLRAGKNPLVERYLAVHAAGLQAHIQRTIAALTEFACQSCPRIVIHCDFHPGNLQFSGSRVSALFDFDWSKVDLRCFDLGLALFYFFASWEAQDGRLRLDQVRLFLQCYQSALAGKAGLGALGPHELRCLPAMIQAGNLYVLNWALLDHIHKAVDPAEYLVYLRHGVNTLYELEQPVAQAALHSLMTEIDGY